LFVKISFGVKDFFSAFTSACTRKAFANWIL
jgi:hypothetical protein